MINRLWSAAIAVVLCVQSCWCDGAGQELFCKDPDTAQYHAVNSTWRSTTFCGNYTCKVRPKNNTATEYIPYIAVNKEEKEAVDQDEKVTSEKEKYNGKEETVLGKKDSMRRMSIDLSNIFHKLDKDSKVKTSAQANRVDGDICYKCNEALDPNDDRYLNAEEVNSISKFLYSVKKSDFDALVEMYKIANDLYGEMETSATEGASDVAIPTQNAPSVMTQSPPNVQPYYAIQPVSGSIPYFYNPTAYTNNKQDYFQDPKPIVINPYSYVSSQYQSQLYSTPQIQAYPAQRLVDIYGQPMQQVLSQLAQDNSLNKLRSGSSQMYMQPYSSYPGAPPYLQSVTSNLVSPGRQSIQNVGAPTSKFDQPSAIYSAGAVPYSKVYLANPIHSTPQSYYNISTYPYTSLIQVPVQYATSDNNYYNGQQPRYYPQNAMKSEDEPRTNEVHKWKSAPLSANTLDSVRAHVLQKKPSLISRPRRLLQLGTPDPARRMKLEKIGKVLRLEGLKRSKRNASFESLKDKEYIKDQIKQVEEKIEEDKSCREEVKRQENETMETYISADRCEMATEPGFFRAGDKTLPFPECCPQRLKDPGD